MSLKERRFTFTWQIQDFSLCLLKASECLKSPVFVVGMLKKSEWRLNLFPINRSCEEDVPCSLECIGCYTDHIRIKFIITACFVDSTKNVTREQNETFKMGTESFPLYISKRFLFDEKDAYLPNDTLTLQCSLWKLDASDDLMNHEVLATVSRDNIQYSRLLYSDVCSVVSRVQVQRKTVYWPIRSFSSIIPNERLTIRVGSALKDVPTFYLTLYKKIDEQRAEIEIRKEKTDKTRTTVNCKISVNHIPKGAECFAVAEHVLEACVGNVWQFPSFIEISKLQENKYLDRTQDVLYLSFEFSFYHSGDLGVVHHVEKDSSSRFESFMKVYPPIEGFGQLYRDGELSDVTIRAGKREFKVHKAIVHARSPVFSAMLNNDMIEKRTGIVDIADIDPETLDRMLDFMYNNAVEDVQTEDAIKLYSAADKYEVLPLKLRCTWILASTLTVSNVCDVLRLADLHLDEYLYDLAVSFVHSNADEIFKSREWEDLMKSNLTIAAKVMHKMLVN